MSFGFGVGDFLAVVALATKIRKEFAGAPSQYKALSDEVRILSVLIQDVESETTGMDPGLLAKVKDAMKNSKGLLRDLLAFIEKHKSVALKRSRLKHAWQRLSMDSKEIGDLRTRIISNILVLRAFTEKSMRDTLVKIEHKVESQDRRQERQKILEWISKDDYEHHRDVQSGLLHLRQPGTRQWLFGSPTWKAWLNTKGTALHCLGIPGAGKTVTTAMVIENLQHLYSNEFALAYIFCNYQQKDKSDLQNVFARSMLRMLLEHQETVPEEVRQCYDKGRDVDVDQIFTLLEVVATRCRTMVIIDALDELDPDPRDKLLQRLSRLQNETSVNVFLTSRDIPEIQRRIAKSFPVLSTVNVEATEDDVLCYLDDSIKLLPNVVQKDATLQEEIRSTIVKSTRGMFLLAHLHIITLRSKRTRKAIQQAISQFSEGTASYQAAYNNAMKRIQDQGQDDREIAMRTLLVLFLARRPLSAAEMCHFVAVDLKSGEDGAFDLADVLELDEILSTCAGLVSYQSEINQVQLVHQSTKEYFKETEARWFPDGEATMRDICEVYNTLWDAAEATGREDKASYLLLDYTRSHWASHDLAAENTIVEGESAPRAAATEIPRESHGGAEQATRPGLRRLGRELNGMGDLLQRASSGGQYALVEVLLTANPTSKGSSAVDKALIAAVRGGHATLVSLLLKNDANARLRDRGMSLLSIAAQAGHLDIIQLLLAWDEGVVDSLIRDDDMPGIHDNWEDYYLRKPFKARKPDVRVFISAFDDELYHDKNLMKHSQVMLWMVSPLSVAALEGHVHIVRFLLELMKNSLEVDDKPVLSTKYQNAAICALVGEQLDAFREILPLVNVNMQMRPIFGASSLFHLACCWNREKFAELLLDDTIPIGVASGFGRSDFFMAVRYNMVEVVRRMLPRVDTALLNQRSQHERSLLHTIAYKGLIDMARILVQRQDLDVNSTDISRDTPLMTAARKGTLKVMQILLQRADAWVNRKNHAGETALIIAAKKLGSEAVRLLLEREDIRLDILNQGRSPLVHAITSIHSLMMGYDEEPETWSKYIKHRLPDAIMTIQHLYTAAGMQKQPPDTMDEPSRKWVERVCGRLLGSFYIQDYSQPAEDPVDPSSVNGLNRLADEFKWFWRVKTIEGGLEAY